VHPARRPAASPYVWPYLGKIAWWGEPYLALSSEALSLRWSDSGGFSSAPSRMPFLNSLIPEPSERINSGIFLPPKSSNTTSAISTISGQPMFLNKLEITPFYASAASYPRTFPAQGQSLILTQLPSLPFCAIVSAVRWVRERDVICTTPE
jgi:hypothetical protein